MNIVQKPANPNNYSPSRQYNGVSYAVKLLVLHTEQGFESGTDSWFANPNSHVSAHYSVALDGQIHQHVVEGATAWHAGNWMVNLQSIGIETEDNDNPQGVGRTDQQYEALAQLVADICHRYGLACNRQTVIRHSEIPNSSHPDCPGNLNADRVVQRAQQILAPVSVVSTTVPSDPGFPRTVQVTVGTLRVRTAPHLNADLVVQPTSDGLLHEGMTFTGAGLVVGDDVNYGPSAHTNLWVRSSRGHYVWAGGTDVPWQSHRVTAEGTGQANGPVPVRTPEQATPVLQDIQLPEWEETFVAAPGTIWLDEPTAAVDMTSQSAPISLDNTRAIQVTGYFFEGGRKYWKGTKSYPDGEYYGIPDTSVSKPEIPTAPQPVGFWSQLAKDPLGALIRLFTHSTHA